MTLTEQSEQEQIIQEPPSIELNSDDMDHLLILESESQLNEILIHNEPTVEPTLNIQEEDPYAQLRYYKMKREDY